MKRGILLGAAFGFSGALFGLGATAHADSHIYGWMLTTGQSRYYFAIPAEPAPAPTAVSVEAQPAAYREGPTVERSQDTYAPRQSTAVVRDSQYHDAQYSVGNARIMILPDRQ